MLAVVSLGDVAGHIFYRTANSYSHKSNQKTTIIDGHQLRCKPRDYLAFYCAVLSAVLNPSMAVTGVGSVS